MLYNEIKVEEGKIYNINLKEVDRRMDIFENNVII